jgi:2-polyprenyl-3-methyl-5-hydroxy-6-metoxy-1,4-benzoquinol methylase
MIGKMDRTKMNNEERVKRNEIKGYHKFVKEFLRWNGSIKSLMTNIEIKSNSEFFKIALSIIKSHGGKKILDFCAGNCWASCTLTNLGYNVVALDMNISNICGLGTIKEYKEKTGVCLTGVVGDCEYVPFKENTFDIAFCHHALHHAYDLDKMVKEISSTVKENGLIIATCEHSRSYFTSDKKFREKHEAVSYGANEHALTVNRYKKAFKNAGLVDIKILPCSGWDVVITMLSTNSPSTFKNILKKLIWQSLRTPILKILARRIYLYVLNSSITIYGIKSTR